MIISGLEIKNMLNKEIFIEPFDDSRLNPNSYNLRLHNELLVYDSHVLDMKVKNETKTISRAWCSSPESCISAEPSNIPKP